MFLPDINLLLATIDPDHEHHQLARGWFNQHRFSGWATCPLTENGFVRILGHPNYPNGPGNTEIARSLLRELVRLPGHQFWADSLSICESVRFPALSGPKNITDVYLLGLAVAHDAQFVTLDQRIDPAMVKSGATHLLIVK
jgi:hypothetical protein